MINLSFGDVLDNYKNWPSPIVIISDGPYGINGYPGDPKTPDELPTIYEPHIKAWSESATAQTTLWFWNTEVGWSLTHPVLIKNGWIYRGCNIWDKGVAHIAGNCNGNTMRKFPVVTEVCAHYVRKGEFNDTSGNKLSLQDWLRTEWKRTGLPLSKANEACGVKNAATRKYLTADAEFYEPPIEVFKKLVEYANKHGDPDGFPYFSDVSDAGTLDTKWEKIRAKFNFEYGVTNVWANPSNRGKERLKIGNKSVHNNQKPNVLIERIIKASSDKSDIIWDVFCGTGSVSLVANTLGRNVYTSEINQEYYDLANKRFMDSNLISDLGL